MGPACFLSFLLKFTFYTPYYTEILKEEAALGIDLERLYTSRVGYTYTNPSHALRSLSDFNAIFVPSTMA